MQDAVTSLSAPVANHLGAASGDGSGAEPEPEGAAVVRQAAVAAAAAPHHLEPFIDSLPKAELHVHLEGTLEPDFMLECARRNGVAMPYADAAAVRAARAHYRNLEDFLAEYALGLTALRQQADFYELADAYFCRAAAEGVRHVELFFDPQAHVGRGVPFSEFFPGLQRAAEEAPQRHGLTTRLIMCFLRDLGPQAAAEVLQQALPYLEHICGVGLDSSEVGHPPDLFAGVFQRAAELGWHRVAHAGEEAGPDYVWAAVQQLGVERIDHGVRCLQDPALVAHLEEATLPLTLCPLSNLRLQVYAGCLEAKLKQLVCDTRLLLTVNSDDPAYFGGYINANYTYLAAVAGLGADQLAHLAANSFTASFLDEASKQRHIAAVQAALQAWWQREGPGGRCGEAHGEAHTEVCSHFDRPCPAPGAVQLGAA